MLAGCGPAPRLPFTNVQVDVPAFTSDRPTTTSVLRVGNNIEETVTLPSAKHEDVEKIVDRLKKKEGWRVLRTDMELSSWTYLLEKDGTQLELIYRAGQGATVIARRRADLKKEQ